MLPPRHLWLPRQNGAVIATPPRPSADSRAIVVHLIDGTYELFRHFYGQRRFNKGKD
jgi:hypothetical protein